MVYYFRGDSIWTRFGTKCDNQFKVLIFSDKWRNKMGLLSFLFKSSEEKKSRKMEKIRDEMRVYVEAEDISNLIRGLKNEHWFARYCAAGGLMDLGSPSLIAVPNLLEVFLSDPNADVEYQAGRALLACGPLSLPRIIFAPLMKIASQKRFESKFILLTDLVIPMARDGVPFLIELLKTNATHLHYYCHSSLEAITGLNLENSYYLIDWYEGNYSEWYEQQSDESVKPPGFWVK